MATIAQYLKPFLVTSVEASFPSLRRDAVAMTGPGAWGLRLKQAAPCAGDGESYG